MLGSLERRFSDFAAPAASHLRLTRDAFISKLNFSGTTLSYSTFLGGDGLDWGFAVTADTGGNAYVAGVTSSSNFPTVSAIS